MNKRNISDRFDFARRYGYDNWSVDCVFSSDCEVKNSPQDSLLAIIYSPDVRSGLPTGDLQYYVSDKANPDVRQFILENLMRDVSSAKTVSNPSGLSDDALLELSRGSNETFEQYMLRLGHEIDTFKFFQEQIKKQDVSVRSEETTVSSE